MKNITVSKEMIVEGSFNVELYEAYPIEDGNVAGAKAIITIDHPDHNSYFEVEIFSSIYIDQGEVLEKAGKLGGLKEKMLPTLLKNHEIESEEELFGVADSDVEPDFDEQMLDYIKQTQKELDDILRYSVTEQVENIL